MNLIFIVADTFATTSAATEIRGFVRLISTNLRQSAQALTRRLFDGFVEAVRQHRGSGAVLAPLML